jgi:hypothetical protein
MIDDLRDELVKVSRKTFENSKIVNKATRIAVIKLLEERGHSDSVKGVEQLMEKTYTHDEMKGMVVEWYQRRGKIMTTDEFHSIRITRVDRSGFTYELYPDVMFLNFEDFEDRSKWTNYNG